MVSARAGGAVSQLVVDAGCSSAFVRSFGQKKQDKARIGTYSRPTPSPTRPCNEPDGNPPVIFLDPPTIRLDPRRARRCGTPSNNRQAEAPRSCSPRGTSTEPNTSTTASRSCSLRSPQASPTPHAGCSSTCRAKSSSVPIHGHRDVQGALGARAHPTGSNPRFGRDRRRSRADSGIPHRSIRGCRVAKSADVRSRVRNRCVPHGSVLFCPYWLSVH